MRQPTLHRQVTIIDISQEIDFTVASPAMPPPTIIMCMSAIAFVAWEEEGSSQLQGPNV